jgi:hypothetical protein
MLFVAKVPFPKKDNLINQAIGGFFMITLGISVVGWAETYPEFLAGTPVNGFRC